MHRATFKEQLKALLWRNMLLKKRNRRLLMREILFPIMFVLFLVGMKAAFQPTNYQEQPASAATPLSASARVETSRLLAFAPNTTQTARVMARVALSLGMLNGTDSLQGFASDADFTTSYLLEPSAYFSGVIFTQVPSSPTVQQEWAYDIRIVGSDVPSTSQRTSSLASCRGSSNPLSQYSCTTSNYYLSGFMALQSALDLSIMQSSVPSMTSTPSLSIDLQQAPLPPFVDINAGFETIVGIYMVLAMSPLMTFLLMSIVLEKENRIKEGMLMMGLRPVTLWLSWFLTYTVIIGVVVLIMAVVARLTQLLAHSNVFLIFLMLYCYGLSLIGFAFMLTPFFSKATTATSLGGLVNIIPSLAYLPISLNGGASLATYWGVSLISPTAISLGFGIVTDYETRGVGLQFSNIGDGDFSAASVMIMCLVDALIYFLLAMYLDAVVPGPFGSRKHPLFFLGCGTQPKSSSSSSSSSSKGRSISGSPAGYTALGDDGGAELLVASSSVANGSGPAIVINGLTKVYPRSETAALNGVSLHVGMGEIFALLGHNGAGKTTLFSILSGFVPPTSGGASVLGYDVETQMEDIRASMGVCPQHDILYPNLTVVEHIELYAGIKGVPIALVDQRMNDLVRSVDLIGEKDSFAESLSGGQKRKLSVAIALVGDPKILVLDEPTAGMDPVSRRRMWTLLRAQHDQRVTLLCTHFMDEADILAHRKAVLHKGKVLCEGTSLFLKNTFGIGYHLQVSKDRNFDASAVDASIKGVMPSAECVRVGSEDAHYMLPLTALCSFPSFFAHLEDNRVSLGIRDFGIASTTLEEVFLKLEGEASASDADEAAEAISSITSSSAPLSTTPTVKSSSLPSERQPLMDDVRVPMDVPHAAQLAFSPPPPGYLKTMSQWQLMAPLVHARSLVSVRNGRLMTFRYIVPIVLMIVGLAISSSTTPSPSTQSPVALDPAALYNDQANSFMFLNSTSASLSPLLSHLSYPVTACPGEAGPMSSCLVSPDAVPSINHIGGVTVTSLDASATAPSLAFTLTYNDTMIHAMPALTGALISAWFASVASVTGANGTASIMASSDPLPFKTTDYFDGSSFGAIFLMGTALSVVPSGFLIEVVADRELGLRHQLRIAGATTVTYWGSFFATHVLGYMVTALSVPILAAAFNIKAFLGAAVFPLIVAMLLYVFMMTLFSYVLSSAFKTAATAQTTYPPLVNILGIIPFSFIAPLAMTGSPHIAMILHYVFCVIDPPYVIFGTLFYFTQLNLTKLLTTFPPQRPTAADYWDPANIIMPTMLLTLGQGIIYAFFLYFIEIVRPRRASEGESRTLEPVAEPEDVAQERAKVNETTPNDAYVYVKGLQKHYVKGRSTSPGGGGCLSRLCATKSMGIGKMAVADLNLSIPNGEVFGLLGPNGSGKTSTIGVLTGLHPQSKGDAFLCGRNVLKDPQAISDLGFCPQFDALWGDLTVSEIFHLYLRLKGFPPSESERRVAAAIDSMKLFAWKDVRVHKLSGGTKRKVSFLISLLSGPRVLIMDEPSTGMDPGARRMLWSTINNSVRSQAGTAYDRAAILTTHSMEEADALSSVVGILVNGRLQCIGTSRELKMTHGNGYQLEITASNVAETLAFVQSLFPALRVTEQWVDRLNVEIPIDPEAPILLSQVFGELESNRARLGIENYAFSMTTLEQVFLRLARDQEEE